MSKSIKAPKVSTKEALSDMKEMIKSPIDVFEKYRKKYGPTFRFRFGVNSTIVTADPDFLRYVLKDNSDNYYKSHIQTKRLVEFQGVGLTNSNGDYWLKQRKHMSMGFTPGRLKETLPIQLEALSEFMASFDAVAEKGTLDIHKQMESFTVRSVGRAIFGKQMQVSDYEKFVDVISEVQQYILKKIVQPYKKPWFRITGQDRKYQKIRREGDQVIMEYLIERRKTLGEGKDILEMIMTTPYKGTDEFMSDEKMRIEILQLLVAGNETSSTASTWAFYVMAKHPECILKIRQEIELVFGDDELSYQKLHDLKYTISVLDEAMRLYPPFWMIDREAQVADEFSGIEIPKGTTIVAYIYGAHQNEAYWQDALTFNPDRFSTENAKKQHPFAHIPFGGGPRVCIGQNMAKMQMLLVISAIVRKYDFSLTDDKELGMDASMLIKPDAPVNMKFSKV